MKSQFDNQFEKQAARREAIYKILPTSKESALTKAELYERLISAYPMFKVQQKPGSESRWQYKTIQRDLKALCFDGKIARYKSSGYLGKNEMFPNFFLDQIDKETWIDLTIRGCSNDDPEDRKEAIKSLKNKIFDIVEKELKSKSKAERKKIKPLSRYKANWKGDWRYFKFDDQKDALHFGKYSMDRLPSSEHQKDGERSLTDSELQQRFVNRQIIPFIPSQAIKDKFWLVIDAIRNKKAISFQFRQKSNKSTTCSGDPLGLWNDQGDCKIVLLNNITTKVAGYSLSFANDIIVSGPARKMPKDDAIKMLEDYCRGDVLSPKKEEIDLLLAGKAALAFCDCIIDDAENYQFDWIDQSNMIARAQFKSPIYSAFLEQILAFGGNVNVIGSEGFKQYLQKHTKTKTELLDSFLYAMP